jgi:hypothetical protein
MPTRQRSRQRFTPDEISVMLRLYVEEKWTVRMIATKLDASYGGVYRNLANRGVTFRKRGTTNRQVHDARVADVTESIRWRIIHGEWEPGSQLPSHRDIRAMFNASKRAITQALTNLRERGYIRMSSDNAIVVRGRSSWT